MSAQNNHPLLCHPAGRCPPGGTVEVAVAFSEEGGLQLRYRVAVAQLRIPAPQAAGPADGLWQHSCCEAFVGTDGAAYREFNFSPSGQWAAYGFSAYRQRDETFLPSFAPQLSFVRTASGFELLVVLDRELLPAGERLDLGLCVVLEDDDGNKTYWALAHGAAQPDFHLRQSFSLPLKAVQS
ncbi:MAG: DOMON-like domain-containing protein [Bacteroidota bacterium]